MYDEIVLNERNLLDESLKQLEFQSVLDYISKFCLSEQGCQIILNLKPGCEVNELRAELNLTDEMMKLSTSDEKIPLENFCDVRPKLHKTMIQNAVLQTSEFLEIRDVLRQSRILKGFFHTSIRQEKYPLLTGLTGLLYENRLLEKHIDETIDDTGDVKDNASKELLRIRREISDKSKQLKSRLQKILKRVSEEELSQDDFISIREGRFVIPIKVEHKRHLPGIIHGISQTGSTVFMEPSEIIETNNELSLLLNEEKREIFRILSNLTSEIGNEAQLLLSAIDILAHFDSLSAKSVYALKFGGIKPDISDDNEISLNQTRHPLLVHSKGIANVVPLSVDFNNNKTGHLISGPNAGGKTVALKSIGLSIAMALSGIYPLGYCRTNQRYIFSSIGDHQSIENDLSTFSSQVKQIKDILSFSDKDSLVLIDEIGSGTDPHEGAALSAGILDTFIEMKSFFVVTTHQSSLKSYALTRKEIENDSLEFDDARLKPTYKFLQGVPGNSYALAIAKDLGITELVLKRAKNYLGSGHYEIEESISILQKYKLEAEKLKLLAEAEKLKAEKSRKEFESKYSDFKHKKNLLLDNARKEALDIINNANSLVENTIKEIREEKRPLTAVKYDYEKEKKSLEKEIRKQDKELSKVSPLELVAGDFVFSIDSSLTGKVLESDDKKKIALVDFNGMKFHLNYNKLIKSDAEAHKTSTDKSKGRNQSSDFADHFKFDSAATIDIRGKRAFEAIRELDNFLSDSILRNSPFITIIHGKGTGALRKAIQEFLENYPAKFSYRQGNLTEGGDGVTIVEF